MKAKQIAFSGLAIALAAIWAVLIYNASYVLTEGIFTLILLFIPTVKNTLERLKYLSKD